MAENPSEPTGTILDSDIVFECPHCSKSLAIDQRGAGLSITCPDCGQKIRVPGSIVAGRDAAALSDPHAQVGALSEALKNSEATVRDLSEALLELKKRRSYLEKVRADNLARFERLSEELSVLQASLDRMVTILQEAASEEILEEKG